jgi:hypothetical protein
MRRGLLLFALAAALLGCATLTRTAADGSRWRCVAFGQARCTVCEAGGTVDMPRPDARSSAETALRAALTGPCLTVEGGDVSTHSVSWARILAAAAVTVLTSAGIAALL